MSPVITQILSIFFTFLGSIIVALISSGRFWDKIEKKSGIKDLNDRFDLKDAKDARRRILRFNDELLNNIRHSQEYFNDILDDIDTYEKYCKAHDEFKNNRTVMATENIRRVYQNCLIEHDFADNQQAGLNAGA